MRRWSLIGGTFRVRSGWRRWLVVGAINGRRWWIPCGISIGGVGWFAYLAVVRGRRTFHGRSA